MVASYDEITQGQQLEQAGDLRGAERLYRQIVDRGSENLQAWFRLGINLLKQRRFTEASAALREVAKIQPGFAEAWSNLGIALASEGLKEDAEVAFRRAVDVSPQQAHLHRNLAIALRERGRTTEAIACFERSLEIEPENPGTLFSLAMAYRSIGQLQQSMAKLGELLHCQPLHVLAIVALSEMYSETGRPDLALSGFQQAIRTDPKCVNAHVGLGVVLANGKRPTEAIEAFRQALLIDSASEYALSNLGNALRLEGHDDEAIISLKRALELQPNHATTWLNLGVTFAGIKRVDEAIQCYRNAIQFEPDYATAHHNLSLAYLVQGNWEHGWLEYEWRWKCKEFAPRGFQKPKWDGNSLDGRTILIHSEQGLGDTLLFIRYASSVKDLQGRVFFQCPESLIPLLSRCEGIDQFVPESEPPPNFDVYAPLLSLPGLLTSTPTNLPASVPYIFPDPQRLSEWEEKLAARGKPRIGIVWRGSPNYVSDGRRSVPLSALGPVVAVANAVGARIYSLQKGSGSEEISSSALEFSVVDLGKQLDEGIGAFMDTAAVMKQLDLVITVDSAPAHLAGALGVPVWVALGYAADWRWLLDREDTPWYPTMRLFRQPRIGDWNSVFKRMSQELGRYLAKLQNQSAAAR